MIGLAVVTAIAGAVQAAMAIVQAHMANKQTELTARQTELAAQQKKLTEGQHIAAHQQAVAALQQADIMLLERRLKLHDLCKELGRVIRFENWHGRRDAEGREHGNPFWPPFYGALVEIDLAPLIMRPAYVALMNQLLAVATKWRDLNLAMLANPGTQPYDISGNSADHWTLREEARTLVDQLTATFLDEHRATRPYK